MIFIAFRSFWTKAIEVILAYLLVHVKVVTHSSIFTEASFIVRTLFLLLVTALINVPIVTFFSFGALAFLVEPFAPWDPFFVVNMKKLAVVAFFASAFEPMDAHSLFSFGSIGLVILRLDNSLDLVDGQVVVRHSLIIYY